MRNYYPALLVALALAAGCTATPTAQPQLPVVAPTNTLTPTPTEVPASATPNTLGLNIIAKFDPQSQVLTIFGVTPAATIFFGGAPILPPPTATVTNVPPPTATPLPTNTPRPVAVAPRPTAVPPPPAVTEASLLGKILFKSSRDGGTEFFAMNADGSGVQKLDHTSANNLYLMLQPKEGLEPGGARIVLEDRCPGLGTCTLYILDTTLDARLINSGEAISHGEWFQKPGFQAKNPVWSPAGNYIAFISNHESDPGCVVTANIFKGTPKQNPTIRRLTSGSDFCARSDAGHPSFSPDGSQLAFWSNGSGLRQIYVLNIGADDTFDFRSSNPHIISDHQSDDWDPLWVK